MAGHNADALYALVAANRYKELILPPGRLYINRGIRIDRAANFATAGMRGAGRNTMLHLIADPNVDPTTFEAVLDFDSQAAIHDSFVTDLGLTSEVNKPLLKMEGYSVYIKNIYCRGATVNGRHDPAMDKQIGILLSQGQHYTLDHCQIEFCAIGCKMVDPLGVHSTHLNVEYNPVCGLQMVTELSGYRGYGVELDGLYSEGNGVAILADDMAFRLNTFVGSGRITLHDCSSCLLDLADLRNGEADVLLTGDTRDTETKMPFRKGHYLDESTGPNSVQVGRRAPRYQPPGDGVVVPMHEPGKRNDHYFREGTVKDLPAGGTLTFAGQFENEVYSPTVVQFYDLNTAELYDVAAGQWSGTSTSYALPYVVDEPTHFAVPVLAGPVDRRVLCSFIHLDAPGHSYTRWGTVDDWATTNAPDPAPVPDPVPVPTP